MLDSRPADQGSTIRRRRSCESCNERFTTYERVEPVLLVEKRSGRTEAFEVRKVRTGLEAALAGRPVAQSRIDDIVDQVEAAASSRGPVVSSEVIGRMVLERLRQLDEVAYVRFASVYKGFEAASDFETELADLERRR